ncbi:MAG: toll/interleukin-1 receptor domain-containing protein [Beijerinckiaceae bacterium]|nr:toll/interleukin-1 receptor domain-containing protein [Beijerinckiaceae bacterium]
MAGSDSGARPNARAVKKRIGDSPAAKEAQLKVWFDKDDLKARTKWQKQLADTVEKQADAFAVHVGAKGAVNWAEVEFEAALSRAAIPPAFPFIPVIAKEGQG